MHKSLLPLFVSCLALMGIAAFVGQNPSQAQPSNDIGAEAGTKINPKDGAKMIFIPAGPFKMGDADRHDNPRHTITLSGYYIYEKPVTVRQYKKFCQETNRQMPEAPDFNPNWSKEDHPMVNVTWEDAAAYGNWAFVDEKIHLPTEAQWEKAARGTDGRKFPWGEEFDNSKLWCSVKTSRSGTAPSGLYAESPFHVFDMAGNVWQWCADYYDADYWKNPPVNDPTGPGFGAKRVLRGGSWGHDGELFFRVSFRYRLAPALTFDDFGFRCASGL